MRPAPRARVPFSPLSTRTFHFTPAALRASEITYGIDAYRKAIHRACDAAAIARWSPHRLRHARGTELARKEGIEVARIALGHRDDRVTRRYAVGAELDLAVALARKHG